MSVLIKRLWQLKTVVLQHWCIISAVLLILIRLKTYILKLTLLYFTCMSDIKFYHVNVTLRIRHLCWKVTIIRCLRIYFT